MRKPRTIFLHINQYFSTFLDTPLSNNVESYLYSLNKCNEVTFMRELSPAQTIQMNGVVKSHHLACIYSQAMRKFILYMGGELIRFVLPLHLHSNGKGT